MNQSVPRKVAGHIFMNGRMVKGTLVIGDQVTFKEGMDSDAALGTMIPSFINSHTHVGDSFVDIEPTGGVAEVVGPGGLKHRMLEGADTERIREGIRNSVRIMEETGTASFIDFRESGVKGLKLLSEMNFDSIRPVILGRPANEREIGEIARTADGFGMSSVSDHEKEFLLKVRDAARKSGKIFAIHFSENVREDINFLKDLRPDLLIHCIETSSSDLAAIKAIGCPVAITAHSNIFFGKRPDYSRFTSAGIELMLGTDNCMITPPDMFAEMSLLYYYQRGLSRISPEHIIEAATEAPRRFLERHNLSVRESYVFFPNALLNAYEAVTRGAYYHRQLISAELR
ncbi:MAG TPA: amidohydrolase family protein [Thermoplasmataceae archaeon]|nr:amidohydrolase family protein [Thermoplasmatales archaeon AK]HLH86583.1 amidohydrolase family protein [Thermoplasmataceae archaeon]